MTKETGPKGKVAASGKHRPKEPPEYKKFRELLEQVVKAPPLKKRKASDAR